jgi:pilus assembly protein CpaC
MNPRAKQFLSALAGYLIVILVAGPQAQQPPQLAAPTSATAVVAPPDGVDGAATSVDLLVGRSTILNIGSPIARVSLTVPDIADALATTPTQLLVHGKAPGTISLFVWDKAGAIKTYEVKVRRDLSQLVQQFTQLFPGEQISVASNGKDVVVSGTVSTKYVVEKAGDVAAGYVDKKENVVNLLKQQEGVASNQVMLRVRFAEVSRSALTELGANLFTGPGGFHDYVARSTTQQFAAPDFELNRSSIQGPPDKWGGGRDTVDATGGKATFSDFLNLFLFNNKYNIGTVVRALQEKGLFQSLAEPNLIATNGKEASFLAGGEFPIPVVQSSANGPSVTIQFKEFGIRLTFTPTVLGGDLINLKVKPEVSALDFNNAIVIDGFRIPALSTRRTDTEVELRDGQTFAIAGLMNNSVSDSMRKIPGIGDIPILGWLFKSKALQKQQTELVVMITPSIVRRGQIGVSEGLPSPVQPYLDPPAKRLQNPDPYVGSPRYPAPAGAPKAEKKTEAAAPAAVAPHNAAPPAAAPTHAAATADPKKAAHDKKAADEAAKKQTAEDKKKAEDAKAALKKSEADRRAADKAAKDKAAKDAELQKKNQEDAKKKAEEDLKRERSLTEAAARLKEAQEAYQAEIDKGKGNSNEKAKGSSKTIAPSYPRH